MLAQANAAKQNVLSLLQGSPPLHQHLFLPKDYLGSPTVSLYTPWKEAELLSYLTAGWGGKLLSVIYSWNISTGLKLKFRGNKTVIVTGSYKYL